MDPWINERFSHRTRRCNYGPLSDAWQGKALEATIDYEAPTMGRRHTRTGDPAEKSDRDVLETAGRPEPVRCTTATWVACDGPVLAMT